MDTAVPSARSRRDNVADVGRNRLGDDQVGLLRRLL
jgi:hypothetical protein